MLLRLRAAWRLLRVALHLAQGMAVVALVYPRVGRDLRLWLKRRWSRQLLAMFGVRLHSGGAIPGATRMLVANHVSWLDIFVINAVEPIAFVAKDDVRDWPLIGWLCARTETLFIERASRRAAHAAGERVAVFLRSGRTVAVFPEGTTTTGEGVLPFRGALLQGAIDAGVGVQPVTLRYVDANGAPTHAPAYCGDTSLLQSMWRIAAAPSTVAHLTYLMVLPTAGRERRMLAAACELVARSSLAWPRVAPVNPTRPAARNWRTSDACVPQSST